MQTSNHHKKRLHLQMLDCHQFFFLPNFSFIGARLQKRMMHTTPPLINDKSVTHFVQNEACYIIILIVAVLSLSRIMVPNYKMKLHLCPHLGNV